ncbi:MAG: hypothetical protein GQ583_08310 [Methyloprofundus sp.]|nr:hypothetical protein [Methyloprofundus sp.]
MNIKTLVFFSLFFILFPLTSAATVFTLYDETQGNLPDDQVWLSYAADGVAATSNAVAGGVQLQTDTSVSVSAGFSNYTLFPLGLKNSLFPTLNSTTGFTLSFTMQLHAETHISNDRAGFSVILLDENNRGVELGFWQDLIWSQSDSPLFQAKDEQFAFDTTASMVDYDLTLLQDKYYLTQGGTILLTGGLKDYSAFTIPYSLPNYLFLGDDTSSASADVTLGGILLSDNALFSVPEPSLIVLICLGLLGLFRHYPVSKEVEA